MLFERRFYNKSCEIGMKLLFSKHYDELVMKGFMVTTTRFCFRSGNPTQAGEREDPGLHPLSESPRQESGVLR